MRLDKLLSNLKYGSRSKIKEMCKKKLISVNGYFITDSDFDVKEVVYKSIVTVMGKNKAKKMKKED